MSLEFISGLLLVLVLLGTLVYVFVELFSGTTLDFSKVSLSDTLGRQRNTEPEPINKHLVGMAGTIVRLSDDSERPMKVRLGSELWPARMDAAVTGDADTASPSVGGLVVVTAVQGPVVIVQPADEAESPADRPVD